VSVTYNLATRPPSNLEVAQGAPATATFRAPAPSNR